MPFALNVSPYSIIIAPSQGVSGPVCQCNASGFPRGLHIPQPLGVKSNTVDDTHRVTLVQVDPGPSLHPCPASRGNLPPPAPPALMQVDDPTWENIRLAHIRSPGQASILSNGVDSVALPHLHPALRLGSLWLP